MSCITKPMLLTAGAAALTACASLRGTPRTVLTPLSLPASVADSVITTPLAPGAQLHRIVNVGAPWRAMVLDMDLRCTTLQALKGSNSAVGRTATSALLAAEPMGRGAIAAINADFFLFAPPGVPTNLHVQQGIVYAGPGDKPVVITNGRTVSFDTIHVRGQLIRGAQRLPLTMWNRPGPNRSGIVDARWGVPLDTIVRRRTWRLHPVRSAVRRPEPATSMEGRYVVRDARSGDTLTLGDTLLLHVAARRTGSDADTPPFAVGDTVQLSLALVQHDRPVRIRDAVGGRPIVLADSMVTRDVDTEGNAGFRNLNPRSAVGVNRSGTRAWLAVIDGRQPGYSMGMTLRQIGELFQALGATQALNLDGGGSSALAVRGPGEATVRIMNRPSDPAERPVGNALGVFSACRKP